MARKRKSSEAEPASALDPERSTTKSATEICQRFNELCRRAGLDIVVHESISVGKALAAKEDKLWSIYRFLSWKNPRQLQESVDRYFESLNSATQGGAKETNFDLLLRILETCRTMTPRTARFYRPNMDAESGPPVVPDPAQPCTTQNCLGEPSSPTPGPEKGKHTHKGHLGSHFKVSKAREIRLPTPKQSVPDATQPLTASQNHNARMLLNGKQSRTDSGLSRSVNQQMPSKDSFSDAKTISFTSTAANTSFDQGTSCWSSQGAGHSFVTNNTSFEAAEPRSPTYDTATDSIGASSMSTSAAGEMIRLAEEADARQTTSVNDKDPQPATSDSQFAQVSARSISDFDAAQSPRKGRRRGHAQTLQQKDHEAESYLSSLGTGTWVLMEEVASRVDEPLDQDMPDIPLTRHFDEDPMEEQRAQETVSVGKPMRDDRAFLYSAIFDHFCRLDFDCRWEASRLLQTGRISPVELETLWNPRDLKSLGEILVRQGMPPQRLPPIALKPWETLTRSARLEWIDSKSGPLCKLTLLALRKDISCSLQRWLGADRVIYVDMPDMTRPPSTHKDRDVLELFRKWIETPLELLGRTWHALFLQPNKKKSTGEGRHSTSTHRLILVAPSQDLSLCDIMQWCLPYDTNHCQAARKAYMRIELLLSRTIPVVTLHPDEIRSVPDQLATRDRDDRRYEDPALKSAFYETYEPDMVMSDGCAQMSYWIAYQYAKTLGLKGVPSTLQIRALGAKGLWYIDDPPSGNLDNRPVGPLFNVAPSQIKVKRKTYFGCDREILSVNVVKANPGARASILHIGYLPILLDRRVPMANICELVQTVVTQQTQRFIEAVESDDSTMLRRWMARNNEFFEARKRETGIEDIAGFPKALEEQIIQMLESGFEAKSNKFLAVQVKKLAASYFDLKNKNFKIELPRSTTLWGIAEPSGHSMTGIIDSSNSLKPGEVCVVFGEPFDAGLGTRVNCLDNVDVLVARNPAMGPSDIQKVRAVYKPHLAKYTNTIVFSARGMRPLANKLQGGDYDGDSFWFTWEPLLTEPFKNAPAPWKPPDPEDLGIKKDQSKLGDHVSDPESGDQWRKYLGAMAMKRFQSNMLGIATLFHERLVYSGLPIGSDEVMGFVHMHDYLVDADKQGYDFSQADFDMYKKSRDLPAYLPEPKYWQFTRSDEKLRQKDESNGRFIHPLPRTASPIDTIFFQVVQPIVDAALDHVGITLESAAAYDADLARFWNETFDSYSRGSAAAGELLRLKDGLDKIRAEWIAHARPDSNFTDRVIALRTMYDTIQPTNPADPIAKEWLRKVGGGYSRWEELKASCFAKHHFAMSGKPGMLVMNVAGAEICHLKLQQVGAPSRAMLLSYYCQLKLRRARHVESADEYNEGEAGVPIEETAYY